jgi:RNA-directed DNA polymerase
MQRQPLKGGDLSRGHVPTRGTGAEGFVVARKPTKVGGAKGARQPAPDIGQLATGGAGERGKAIRDLEAGGVEGLSAGEVEWGRGGVDAESIEAFEQQLKDNLYRLWNRMASGTYFPPPVREVVIPKRDGGERKLGIPTVADRIAQTVVKNELEPKVEPSFHGDSYGYRPGKSAVDAVGRARERCWEYDWVVDLDIRAFFDTLDHALVMRAVRKYTDCRWVLLYVERWLTAPVRQEDGTLTARQAGTPQGGVVSPLLANIFLHLAFDAWMEQTWPQVPFERYADDSAPRRRREEAVR